MNEYVVRLYGSDGLCIRDFYIIGPSKALAIQRYKELMLDAHGDNFVEEMVYPFTIKETGAAVIREAGGQ